MAVRQTLHFNKIRPTRQTIDNSRYQIKIFEWLSGFDHKNICKNVKLVETNIKKTVFTKIQIQMHLFEQHSKSIS